MMLGRRTFIQGTALVATAPVLADFLFLSATAQSNASPLPGPLPAQLPAQTDMNGVIFRIYGWDSRDDVPVNGATIASASADPLTNDPPGDQVLIRISQSWRAAWQ
jgi:hypothetical protein